MKDKANTRPDIKRQKIDRQAGRKKTRRKEEDYEMLVNERQYVCKAK